MDFDQTATETTAWSDLERSFFASAPPDEPEPAESVSFDDLVDVPARSRRPRPTRKPSRARNQVRRPIAPAAARDRRRVIAVVLAAVALLVGLGLSAAVLAAG